MRLIILLICLSGFAFAQSQTTPAVPTNNEKLHLPGTYQLYLNEPAHKVKKVEYMDGTTIPHKLSPDGETLYLLDYPKRGRVKVFTEDEQGESKVIERSPCYIDPVINS